MVEWGFYYILAALIGGAGFVLLDVSFKKMAAIACIWVAGNIYIKLIIDKALSG